MVYFFRTMNKNVLILTSNELFHSDLDFYIHKSSDLPDFIETEHCHDFIEISYVLSGECDHIENETVRRYKKGDLFIINYLTPHFDIKIMPDNGPFVTCDLAFRPEFIDMSLAGKTDFFDIRSSFLFRSFLSVKTDLNASVNLHDNSFNEIESLLKKMLDEYRNRQKGYADILRIYLLELLIKIFRQTEPDKPVNTESYIDLALRFIQDNYSEKISIKDIAYRSFFSKSYFAQLFKKTTGVCFSDYLQKVRVEKACELLRSTGFPIEEIVPAVGFCDTKFFYTVFKKQLGLTPGEYRRSCRGAASRSEQPTDPI